MKTLNINSYVKIKLTPFGIEKLKEEHENLRNKCASIGNITIAETLEIPEVDEEGYSKMQLWKVMNIFGKYLYNGSINLPFETNIQIEDTQFEESKK